MHLFQNNRSVDLFNSLQMLRIRFNSGEGVQSLIKYIADRKYGYVSKKFKKVLLYANQGLPMEKALEKVQLSEKNKYLNFLLSSMKISVEQDVDMNYALDDVEQKIIDDHKENIDKFITHTNKGIMFQLYVAFGPFLYIMLEIMNWVVVDFMEGTAFLDDTMRMGFFIANTAVLAIVLLMIRYYGD